MFYPDVELPKEVIELNQVSYVDDNIFNYVDPINMKEIIDYLRKFDMLNGDPEKIIEEITNKVMAKKRSR